MLQEIRKLLHDAIRGTDFEDKTYFAGGCVRDELLGRQTSDLDITVELQDGGIRLADFLHKQGLCSKPVIYKQFGTALIFWNDYKIELVMTRRESYRSRSRKPEVAFGTLLEDVLRRDFTINSLLMRVTDGKILDLSGKGQIDLKAKLIRATSDPEVLFKEDPLRILRAVRFATTLDFSIEKNTLCTLKRMVSVLKQISKERIAEEFLKIMSNPDFPQGLRLLKKTGIMRVILPNLRVSSGIIRSQHPPDIHLGSTWGEPTRMPGGCRVKLALLLWRQKDPTTFLKLLKLSQKEIEKVKRLTVFCKTLRYLQRSNTVLNSVQLRRMVYLDNDILPEIVILFPLTGALQNRDKSYWKNDVELCKRLSHESALLESKRFSLTGDDLMRTFCSENGSWVGEMLLRGREYWFAHPDADKKELMEYLAEHYQKRC
jgi:tRNA nucleotidyltransferase/poly(A) polymerase